MPVLIKYHPADDTHPADWQETSPDPRPIADQLADRLAQLAYERWSRGLTVTFNGILFASDDTAGTRLGVSIQARQVAQAASLEAADATANWYALDGSAVPMTLPQQQQLLLTGVVARQAGFDHEASIAAQLRAAAAANDPAALDAVDLTAGWPS